MAGVDAGRPGAHARPGGRTRERADAVPGGASPGGASARGAGGAHDAPGARSGPGAPDAPGPAGAAARRPLALRLLVPVLPGVLGLITGLYHSGVPPLWRDEAATKAIASRPVTRILATLPHDDVVHGVYYLVVHVFIRLFGSSNGALRLPSAIAAAVACALTALVAQRLADGGGRQARPSGGAALTGVTAGAVLALLPAMIRYAQEARSYAIVAMLAAIATYLLLRALDDGRRGRRAAYGAAVFLTGLFNIFGLLIVVAHGLTLLATGWGTPGRRSGGYYRSDFAASAAPGPRGRRLLGVPLGWLTAGLVAVLLLVPLVGEAYAQRNALSWMTGSASLGRNTLALAHFWAGSPGLVWPVFGLAALGVLAPLAGPRSLSPATVALPWLVAPPAILLAVSTTHPVYDQRYVEFCLPALAICTASGISWLGRLAAMALGGLTRVGSASGRGATGRDASGRDASGRGVSGRGAVGWLACACHRRRAALAVALQRPTRWSGSPATGRTTWSTSRSSSRPTPSPGTSSSSSRSTTGSSACPSPPRGRSCATSRWPNRRSARTPSTGPT